METVEAVLSSYKVRKMQCDATNVLVFISLCLARRGDGSLVYRATKDSPDKAVLSIVKCRLQLVPVEAVELRDDASIAITVDCHEGRRPTSFRCLLPLAELYNFTGAIKQVSPDNNCDEFLEKRRQTIKVCTALVYILLCLLFEKSHCYIAEHEGFAHASHCLSDEESYCEAFGHI